MTDIKDLKLLFAGHYFGPPAEAADLLRAESILGEPIPASLKEFYLAFDGFRGPTNAGFFWPIFGFPGLVRSNRFLRDDELFPHELVTQCLFFGDNGCGPLWGFKQDLPGKVIQWDVRWGLDFEIAGDCPLDVWRAEKHMYDSLDDEA